MPDKKLTDNLSNNSPILSNNLSDSEIVKALECCIKWKREGDCAKCPLYESDKLCVKEIRILALDLINRLQAKDETRHKVFETKCEELEIAKAENERLKEEKSKLENKIDEIYPLVMQLPNAMQQAKAEAVTEFAESLKSEIKALSDKHFEKQEHNICEALETLNSRIESLLKNTVS